MIDVSSKPFSLRTAVAQARLKIDPATSARITQHDVPKGNPFAVAKVAAIQAAKATSTLIPYCHPVPVSYVDVTFSLEGSVITVTVTVKAIYSTGVEMEAMTGASIAALTLYDMLKAIDQTMQITSVRLLSKSGGKSQSGEFPSKALTAAVLVISDSVAAGIAEDGSGKLIEQRLTNTGVTVSGRACVPDEPERIRSAIINFADEQKVDLIISTGGTGISPRDCTPEAMAGLCDREIPGIPEVFRAHGQQRTPYAMLSRGRAGIRGNTIIVNLPGSEAGVTESLDALLPGLLHAISVLQSGGTRHIATLNSDLNDGLS
jgi:cyclic pyranopterin phosphate synthase